MNEVVLSVNTVDTWKKYVPRKVRYTIVGPVKLCAVYDWPDKTVRYYPNTKFIPFQFCDKNFC
jgi:hypothetical protein